MNTSFARPKYQQLTDRLRQQIVSGELKPGERLPSFSEMSVECGATTTTLTRVYAALQQEGLISREQGRGTFVKKRPSFELTGTVGLLGTGSADFNDVPYYAYLLQGMRGAAEREGFEILLLNDPQSPMQRNVADGLLLLHHGDASVLNLLPPGMPCVSLIHAANGIESVIANDHLGAKLATEHLVGLGHKRIAYMIPRLGGPIEGRRLAGYHAALWEAGIEPSPDWVNTLRAEWKEGWDYKDVGFAQMTAWLRGEWSRQECSAILAGNDEMALGIIAALQQSSLRVPQDVSVVGFDGTRAGEYSNPQLTSVEVPLREIGARGVELLCGQIRGGFTSGETAVLPVRLLERESTAPPR